MRKRKKRIIRSVLFIEVIMVSLILILILIKGDLSFHIIDTMEAFSQTQKQDDKEDSIGESQHVTELETGEEATGEEIKEESDDGSGVITDDTAEVEAGKTDGPNDKDNANTEKANTENTNTDNEKENSIDTITISAAGDVTLGRDLAYGYERSFDHEFELQKKDYGYFFRNVKDIFEADDLTIVNLETTLTTADKPSEKKFRFKADPSYAQILKEGDIEAVSIANNHTRDYLEKGYKDTLATLESAEIGYFGYEHKYIKEVRGIKIGVLGYTSWEVSKKQKEEIGNAIDDLRTEGADIVIVMFHWGIERDYWPNYVQKELSRFVIDRGADLVLGGHPHVLQGIEEYKGKKIVYSLGNFSFGGNKNPSDKDSMIYVHKFNFQNGELISEENEIIPCSISSVKDRNNYQPTPLKDSEKERVLNKIEKYSKF